MKTPVKVLIVEDSEDDAKLALRALRAGGFEPAHRRVQTAADLKTALAEERWDAVISDFQMPGFTGMDALKIFRSTGLDIPFILVSGTIGEETATNAMKAGASDYVMKKSLARLAPALERELKETQTRVANRQTHAALTDSEARFRQMAENIRDVFFLRDADSDRMLYVSPAYEEIWGRSRESLYASPKSWTEAIHPDDRTSTDEKYKKGTSTGKLEFEYRIVHPDGSIRWVETRGFPVRDDAGKIVRIAGVVEDITDRMRQIDDLRRLRAAMDASVDAIYLVDRTSMRFIYVNDAACRMRSETREEVFALGPEGVLSTSRAELERVYDSIIAGGAGTEPIEMQRQRKDGSRVWVELRRRAQRSREGWMIVTLVRDITERKHGERLVRESATRFKAIFDQAPVGMALLDKQGHPIISNSSLSKMVGYSNDELSKMNFSDFTYPEDVDKDLDQFSKLMEGKIPAYSMEKRFVHKDGHLIWANIFVTVLLDENGVPQDIIGMAEDITEGKLAEIKIKRLNRVYAMLSGINTLIVRVHDRDELFSEACRIAVEHGQFKMAWMGIVDRDAMKIVPIAVAGWEPEILTLIKDQFPLREDAPMGNTMSARAVRERRAIVSNTIRDDANNFFVKELIERGIVSMATLPLLVADEAVGVFGLFAGEIGLFDEEEMKLLAELAGDIAYAIDHIDKQERLDYLAYYDALTGLANRTLFLERVTQYIRSAVSGGYKLAVFLIDLQRFKNINDSLGRPAGDALLRQVAEWLAYNTGDANLVARLDADHFAAVMPQMIQDGDVARALGKLMDAFVDHPFRLNDAVFRIAARVGVAVFPDDGTDADTLFRHAEAALKQAKASGERYLFYTQQMTTAVAGKVTLENQLRQALDNEEFVLHYQPKVNLVSGKLTSAEALIRWNDPRTGLVPPGRFIPILEETGLIYEVGRWALKKAIEDYLRWRTAGLNAVRIAVNVSPLQLRNRGFVAEIAQVIGIEAQAPAALELEITESLIMEDVKHNIASLQAIRALGIRIAIDDFGTGFSSLAYLAKLPVDTLKIDRSFVIEMTTAPEGLALISTIINLAHSLKLKVVAEGVETGEQSRLLRLLDCDEMQGFLFSKPVPTEIFETRFLALPSAG